MPLSQAALDRLAPHGVRMLGTRMEASASLRKQCHRQRWRSVLICLGLVLALAVSAQANHSTLRVDPFNPNPINSSGQPAGALNTRLREALDHELAQQGGERFAPFVSSGGIHPTSSSLTAAAFATTAHVPERVSQTATAITYAAIANDVCWTIISSDNNGITGWTRVGSGSTGAYYYQCEGDTTPNQPDLPANSTWLLQITVTNTAIAAVQEIGTRRIAGVETVNTARTVGSRGLWIVEPGGSVVLNANVTFGGGLRADHTQLIFSGTGALTCTAGHSIRAVHPEWWGRNVTPGTTDMVTALNAAISTQCPIELLDTTYAVSGSTGATVAYNGAIIRGQGMERSILRALTSGMRVLNLTTAQTPRFADFSINGNSLASYGIYLADSAGIQGIFRNIEITNVTVSPGVGFETTDRNHTMLIDHPWFTFNTVGLRLLGRAEEATIIEPLIYYNTSQDIRIGDDTELIHAVKVIGGLITATGTVGAAVTNVYIRSADVTFIGLSIECANNAASRCFYIDGASRSRLTLIGGRSFGNNISTVGIDLTGATGGADVTLIDHHMSGFLSYPVSGLDSTKCLNIQNSVLDQVTGTRVPFFTSCNMEVGIATGFSNSLIGRLNVGQPDSARIVVNETTGDNSDTAGILFGVGSNPTATIKGGIIFRRTTTFGRGELYFCNDTFGDNGNVGVGDCQWYINADGFLQPVGQTFAAMSATAPNNSIQICTDCTVTSGANNTCTSGGTGALAVRLAGVWRCFNQQN